MAPYRGTLTQQPVTAVGSIELSYVLGNVNQYTSVLQVLGGDHDNTAQFFIQQGPHDEIFDPNPGFDFPTTVHIDHTDWGANIDPPDDSITPAVPQPSTWAMMILGFAGVGFARIKVSRSLRPDRASLQHGGTGSRLRAAFLFEWCDGRATIPA